LPKVVAIEAALCDGATALRAALPVREPRGSSSVINPRHPDFARSMGRLPDHRVDAQTLAELAATCPPTRATLPAPVPDPYSRIWPALVTRRRSSSPCASDAAGCPAVASAPRWKPHRDDPQATRRHRGPDDGPRPPALRRTGTPCCNRRWHRPVASASLIAICPNSAGSTPPDCRTGRFGALRQGLRQHRGRRALRRTASSCPCLYMATSPPHAQPAIRASTSASWPGKLKKSP